MVWVEQTLKIIWFAIAYGQKRSRCAAWWPLTHDCYSRVRDRQCGALGSLLPRCKLLGGAAKSLKMLSWSYSGIPEMQVWTMFCIASLKSLCWEEQLCCCHQASAVTLQREAGWALGFVSWRTAECVFSVNLGNLLFPSLLMSTQSGLLGYFYCLGMTVGSVLTLYAREVDVAPENIYHCWAESQRASLGLFFFPHTEANFVIISLT